MMLYPYLQVNLLKMEKQMFNEVIGKPNQDVSSLEILNTVHTFYSESFSSLFTMTVTMFALMGVVMPIVIQIIQWKLNNHEIKKLQVELKKIVDDKLIDVKKEYIQEVKRSKHYARGYSSVVLALNCKSDDKTSELYFELVGAREFAHANSKKQLELSIDRIKKIMESNSIDYNNKQIKGELKNIRKHIKSGHDILKFHNTLFKDLKKKIKTNKKNQQDTTSE